MKCDQCGFEFEEGMFCPNCGQKIVTYNDEVRIKEEEKANAEEQRIVVEKQVEIDAMKAANKNAIFALVLSILAFPASMILIGIPMNIAGIVLGIIALKRNTLRKNIAITSIVLGVTYWVICGFAVIGVILK